MTREIKYYQAINEAIDLAMTDDPSVYLMGLGVPDPRGVFSSTLGLQEKHGAKRVMDMPTSENGMTGIAIGSALVGMKPIMVHQRLDFALLALEQIVNQAANWHYMFGGQIAMPLVIRMIIGRGWGQGPQHSQSLQSWFAHVPGLKVIMPTTPYDVKGLLMAAIKDKNPVICLEHRWLYNITGLVPEEPYQVPMGKAHIIKEGEQLTIVALSHMTLEAIRAAQVLEQEGISTEVIDVRTLKPLDDKCILDSVRKTGRLIVTDTAWKTGGFSAEILARVTENAFNDLKCPPQRIALPDCPSPTAWTLTKYYYPRAVHIVKIAREMLGLPVDNRILEHLTTEPLDIPDPTFTGPF